MFESNALFPNAVLLVTDPPPRPTVSPLMLASPAMDKFFQRKEGLPRLFRLSVPGSRLTFMAVGDTKLDNAVFAPLETGVHAVPV